MTLEPRLNARILVIDDEEAVRDSFRTVLRRDAHDDERVLAAASVLFDEPRPSHGSSALRASGVAFELDVAEDGARGVEMVRAATLAGRPYAVVFCDIRMPGMDGIEAVTQLRAIDRRAEVVFITAYSDHGIEAITERAGADVGYFVKPFISDEMRQLATKLVIEWNKAREIEALVRAVAALRGERRDIHRLVEHLLREICMWLDTDSAALLRRARGGGFAFDLGVGTLAQAETVREVLARLNGRLLEGGAADLSVLPDGTSVLPIHEFGVAIALSGRHRITPDRRYLLEVFLENAAFALRHNDIATRLAEAERLASVGRAMGYIVHDLRNPLGVAQMLAHVQAEDADTGPEAREVFHQIEIQIRRAVELLNDTLAVCRKDLRVKPANVDAGKLLDDGSALWRVMLSQRGVPFTVSCAPGTVLYADARAVERVLHNLTKNAADAVIGRDGGRVEVGAGLVDDGAELWVADNGPGVSEALLPSLFQPFATEGKDGGTGFGLAIVQQVSEAHGGSVRYAREAGMSRFTVHLPAEGSLSAPAKR